MIKLKSNISVIIPCWNSEKTIKKALGSCLTQTLPPLEILVCDDASTDKTEAVAQSLRSPLIKWIGTQTHSGRPATPRNRGLKEARGRWLAFLDADDSWLADKLRLQMAAVKQTKCLAACTNAYRKTPDHHQTLFFDLPARCFGLTNLLLTNYVICSSMLIHRSLLDKAAGFPENNNLSSVEDYSLWLRVAAQTKIAYLDKPLVIYRDAPGASVRAGINQNPLVLKGRVLADFCRWLLAKK